MSRSFAVVAMLALLATLVSGQAVTTPNTGFGGPPAITSSGTCHAIDTTAANIFTGVASVSRTGVGANTCYFPTGWGIDPTVSDDGGIHNAGFTIMFAYKPATPAAFAYLFGDATWVGSNGAFRCFQNGAAGANEIIIRGPLTQVATTGGSLLQAGLNGFIHYALTFDSTTNTLTWYVNGVLSNSLVTAIGPPATGSNLTIVGYNGSASAGPQGNTDDYRLYNHARTAGEIAAEYNVAVGGAFTPTQGGYEFELQTPTMVQELNSLNKSATFDTTTRILQGGDTIEWAGRTDPGGMILASTFLNLELGIGGAGGGYAVCNRPPTATAVAYDSSALGAQLASFELGHALSTPVNPFPIIWPDGLNVGPLAGGVGGIILNIPPLYMFETPPTSGGAHPIFATPGATFASGDKVQIQSVGVELLSGFLSVTNRATFIYEDPDTSGTGGHCRVECDGNSGQTTGFWEFHNLGALDIQSVTIDLAPTGLAFVSGGAINSGGTLSLNTSNRWLTDLHTTYTGYMDVSVGAIAEEALQFNFTDFNPGEIMAIDCQTSGAGFHNGNLLVGALVTVVFDDGAGGTVTVGPTALAAFGATGGSVNF